MPLRRKTFFSPPLTTRCALSGARVLRETAAPYLYTSTASDALGVFERRVAPATDLLAEWNALVRAERGGKQGL